VANKWYEKEAFDKIEKDILNKLEEVGQLVSAKAKTNAPVITGALRDSIDYEIIKVAETVRVGTNIPYGPIVELGLGRLKYPRFFLKRALEESKGRIIKIFNRKVK